MTNETAFELAGKDSTGAADPQSKTNESSTSSVGEPSIPPELNDLIGEGKKYANVSAALKSIVHAQKHIEKLEAETADLRARKADVDEILANMGNGSSQTGETPAIDDDAVADKVIKKLQASEQEKLRKQNLVTASDKLAEIAGGVDGAAKLIAQKASELGLHPNDLQDLAKTSPKAFLAYFNTTPNKETASGSSKGTVNTEALNTGNKVTEGSYAWYKEQRKTKGDAWYFSEATTKARMKDAEKLGREKFFGG